MKVNVIIKKVKLLLLVCMCVGLSACSKENKNENDSVSRKEWLSASEKMDVYLVEQLKTVDQIASAEEEQSVIRLISQLSDEDFTTAPAYDYNTMDLLSDNQVIFLFQSEIGNTKIYGGKSMEYGTRGIIVYSDGEYSYFDIAWSGNSGEMEFYEQDFDFDGQMEIAFCFAGAMGNGVEIYRLIMFDTVEECGKLEAYEFSPEMQMEQFKNKLQFAVDVEEKDIKISKDSEIIKTIDWENAGIEAEAEEFGIDCLNQITFDIDKDGIKMHVDVGILVNKVGPTIFFENEEGKIDLDVIYSDGRYEIGNNEASQMDVALAWNYLKMNILGRISGLLDYGVLIRLTM